MLALLNISGDAITMGTDLFKFFVISVATKRGTCAHNQFDQAYRWSFDDQLIDQSLGFKEQEQEYILKLEKARIDNLTLNVNSMLLVFQTNASWEHFNVPVS